DPERLRRAARAVRRGRKTRRCGQWERGPAHLLQWRVRATPRNRRCARHPSNWHDNSNQSYDLTMLVLARPEGFSSIGDVFALGSRTCREVVTEETTVRVVRDGAPLARIDVEARRRIQKLAEDCETKLPHPAVALFRGRWRWNAKKAAYEARADELARLAA